METNTPSEGSAHSAAGACDSFSHEHQAQSHQTIRSYECNFCKKGFSNAQALGGHMNIHRKDKAKLKKAAKIAQKPPDSSRLVGGLPASRIFEGKPSEFTSRSIGKNMNNAKLGGIVPSNHQEVCAFPRSRNFSQMAQIIQLPMGNRAEYSRPIINQHVTANWQEIERLHSTDAGGELDLELRLGYSPSPPREPSVTTGTIKFF